MSPVEFRVPPVDAVALKTRAAGLATRSFKKQAKVNGLVLAVVMMDLTTLEGVLRGCAFRVGGASVHVASERTSDGSDVRQLRQRVHDHRLQLLEHAAQVRAPLLGVPHRIDDARPHDHA